MNIGLIICAPIAQSVLFQLAELEAERDLLLLIQILIPKYQELALNERCVKRVACRFVERCAQIKASYFGCHDVRERRDFVCGLCV